MIDIEKLKDRVTILLGQERGSIGNKGRGYYMALGFNVVCVWIVLTVCNSFWPNYAVYLPGYEWYLYFFGYMTVVFVTHLVNFAVYQGIDFYNLFPDNKITKTNLPWEKEPAKWEAQKKKAIICNLINIGIVGPFLVLLDSFKLRVNFSPTLPSTSQVMYQIYVCMAVEALLFYLFHRIGHDYLYQFHKVHHQFTIPCPLATNNFHPIDYVIGAAIPFAVGVRLFGKDMHFITFIMWTIWRISEGYEGHSNYEFSWSPFRVAPFSTSSEYHSYHHTHNIGNFGSTMTIEDTLAGTNTQYFKYKAQIRQKTQ